MYIYWLIAFMKQLILLFTLIIFTSISRGQPSNIQSGYTYEEALALYNTRFLKDVDLSGLRPTLESRATLGDSRAHALLSLCYFYGLGGDQDLKKAWSSANAGGEDPNALFMLARLEHQKQDANKSPDYTDVIRLYRKAAETGSAAAYNNLATLLGTTKQAEASDILALYQKAGDLGDIMGYFNLAKNLRSQGELKKALQMYAKVADDFTLHTVDPVIEASARKSAAYAAGEIEEAISKDRKETSDKQEGEKKEFVEGRRKAAFTW